MEWVVQTHTFMHWAARRTTKELLWNWLERGSILLGFGWLLLRARTASEPSWPPRFNPARDRRRFLMLFSTLGVPLLACAHTRMLPAPTAHTVAGAPEAAAEEVGGLRISAEGDDWNANPVDLSSHLTPVKIRIVNHSGAPARIEYAQFTLVGGHGHVYRAIPVVPLEHETPRDGAGTIHPIYAASRFFVAPRYHDLYPTLPAWSRPLERADGDSGETLRFAQGLPTRAMERMGLPEGVLDDGGEISGFLYFENATKRESRLTFQAAIADGQHGERELAEIEIPFRVE
jgi:hypothetical protein